MIKNVRKRSLVAAAALFLVAGPFTGTAVGQDSELDLRDAGQPARVQAASTDADLDALTLPILSEQMARLASDLMETFGEDPNFASAEVTRDRSSLIVHWHVHRPPRCWQALTRWVPGRRRGRSASPCRGVEAASG